MPGPVPLRVAVPRWWFFLRTMPELAGGGIFVMAFGIGAIPASLGINAAHYRQPDLLFYEVVEERL